MLGNIHRDQKLRGKYEEMSRRKLCETVKISRLESQRVRMRKTSDRGTDIALTLAQGTKLRHGDVVMLTEDKMVVVEIEPEKVAMISIRENLHADDLLEVPVKVGHTIGNLHRPIKLVGNKIYFPIQTDAELEMFKKLFAPLGDHLEIKSSTMVFEPEEGTEVHEHG